MPKLWTKSNRIASTLFKNAKRFSSSCDECQRVGNITRRNEMPMNYSLVIEPFDCWGFDFMVHRYFNS